MEIKGTLDVIKKFEELDDALLKLGFSDSSIMYASHIRDEFDICIDKLNVLKESLGIKSNDSDWYFDDNNIENLKVIEELEGDGL